MTKEELIQIIRGGENQQFEVKKSFDHKALIAINALTNSTGGYVLIGVSDEGKITGVSLAKESLPNWMNEIKQKFEPQIIPELSLVTIDSSNVVVIRVDEFPVKPVGFQVRYYQHKNNSNIY